MTGHLAPIRALGKRLTGALRLHVWIWEHFGPGDWQGTLAWAALAGVLGATGALAFTWASEGTHELLTGSHENVVESFRRMPWWGRLLVPAAGGLCAGLILAVGRRMVRPPGSGTDYMEAIVIGSGHVPLRASLVRIAAALFSIGSGGSIGREGPMVQLAAIFGSNVGRWRRLPPPRLRLLVACGAAAGITSAYNAPIAGAFFIAEIILGTIAMESLGPLVVASVAASLTMRTITDVHVLYEVPSFTLDSLWEMPPYLVLGLVGGGVAPWFLRSLRSAERLFAPLRSWPMVSLAAGGLVVGAIAIRVPEVCGNGYSVVVDILNGRIVWYWLALVFVCKWLATAASFGSGAPGGVFTPALFMGASVGYLFGVAVHSVWPAGAADPQAFALVGMGAFLAAATHAPVMAMIMLFEMTLSYDIILPLMVSSVIAYYAAKSVEGESLYSEALARRSALRPPAPVASVADLMRRDPSRVGLEAPLAEIARMFLSERLNHIYVVDREEVFVGVVSLHDVKPFLATPDRASVAIARDLLRTDFPAVHLDQSLEEALGPFLHIEANRLPVVAHDRTLVGSLAKNDLLLAVEERLRTREPALRAGPERQPPVRS